MGTNTEIPHVGLSRHDYWLQQYNTAVDVLTVIGHKSAALITDQARMYADHKTSQLFGIHVKQIQSEREQKRD